MTEKINLLENEAVIQPILNHEMMPGQMLVGGRHYAGNYAWDSLILSQGLVSGLTVNMYQERTEKSSVRPVSALPAHMNSQNLHRKSKSMKPKNLYKGVFPCGKKFKAQVQTKGVQFYLGIFDTAEEAAKAYDAHAIAMIGAKAKTNFPIPQRNHQPAIDGGATFKPQTMPEIVETSKGAKRILKRVYEGVKTKKRVHMDMDEAPQSTEVVDGRNIMAAAIKKLKRQAIEEQTTVGMGRLKRINNNMDTFLVPLENLDIQQSNIPGSEL